WSGGVDWKPALHLGGASVLPRFASAHLVVARASGGNGPEGRAGETGEASPSLSGFPTDTPRVHATVSLVTAWLARGWVVRTDAVRRLVTVSLVTGGVALSWVVLTDGVVRFGGAHTQWVSVGVGGLVPEVAPGLYWVASRITLLWAAAALVLLHGVPVCSLLY